MNTNTGGITDKSLHYRLQITERCLSLNTHFCFILIDLDNELTQENTFTGIMKYEITDGKNKRTMLQLFSKTKHPLNLSPRKLPKRMILRNISYIYINMKLNV